MEIPPGGRKSLGSMDVGTDRYPYSLEAWVTDHCSVVIVELNAQAFVLVACPSQFRGLGAANGNHIGIGNTVEESADMTLAHSFEASDGDVDFDVLRSGGGILGSDV